MTPNRVGVALVSVVSVSACAAPVPQEVASPATTMAAPGNAQTIDWNQAIAMLRSGRVMAIVQLHDLTVTLTVADGARFITREPAIDAIFSAIAMHAPNAGSIIQATE